MLLWRSCIFLCSLLAVCWTESALGNEAQENHCSGVCLATSKATELCEVVSATSRCQEDQLCCLRFNLPDVTTAPGDASWGRSSRHEETGRQYRNIYLDILGVIATEVLRAAIASEYEAIKEKSASFNATKQTYLTSGRVTTSPENSSSKSPSQSSTARSVSSSGSSDILTPYELDSDASTEPYVSYSSDDINAPPSTPASLSSSNGSSSGSPTAGSTNESAQHSPSSSTSHEAVSATEEPGLPCPGNCVPSFVSWFCYNPKSDYDCPQGSICCAPAPTTPEPVIPSCPGTCLAAQLTGLCKKPARLLLKTTTCNRETICCTDTPRIW